MIFFPLSYVNFDDKVRALYNKGPAYFVGSLCRKFSKISKLGMIYDN